MLDSYGRRIHYLRISVTDRCNLRCRYCMPEDGVPLLDPLDILSFEEIVATVRAAVALGFDKVRLTGGEPLVRCGIEQLVAMLAALPGVRDLSLTTNGLLLAKYAVALRAAGLQRVNVSLDTLDPTRFADNTRGGNLRSVLDGIAAAKDAGLQPIKLNCVVEHSAEEPDARAVAAYAAAQLLPVRFIRRMHLASGRFGVVEHGGGGDCVRCNRLRLSSDGWVRPCLFSDIAYSVRELGAARALELAILNKPESGQLCLSTTLSRIGG